MMRVPGRGAEHVDQPDRQRPHRVGLVVWRGQRLAFSAPSVAAPRNRVHHRRGYQGPRRNRHAVCNRSLPVRAVACVAFLLTSSGSRPGARPSRARPDPSGWPRLEPIAFPPLGLTDARCIPVLVRPPPERDQARRHTVASPGYTPRARAPRTRPWSAASTSRRCYVRFTSYAPTALSLSTSDRRPLALSAGNSTRRDGDGIVAAMRVRLGRSCSSLPRRAPRALHAAAAASASPSPSSTSPASRSPRSSAPSCAPACAAGSPPASTSSPTPRSSAPSPSAASPAATRSPACAASASWSWCGAWSRRPSRSSAVPTSPPRSSSSISARARSSPPPTTTAPPAP